MLLFNVLKRLTQGTWNEYTAVSNDIKHFALNWQKNYDEGLAVQLNKKKPSYATPASSRQVEL